jgi:Ca2+-binding RTX toxin-like protein
MRLLATAILISTAAVLGFAATAGAAPVNDEFAAAVPIADAEGTHAGTTVGATKEPGEPDHAGNPGGHSIWYAWTAPETGTFVFYTANSAFDTLLAVYAGADVGALTEVASNDDVVGVDTTRSRVAFVATKGTTYAVAVDGFGGKSGRSELGWRPGLANDLFAQRAAIAGAAGSVAGTNVGATMEDIEPSPSLLGSSVWYEWTAPRTGKVKLSTFRPGFNTGAEFDTVVAVYTGSSLDTLSMIASNDDDPFFPCCASSFVPFDTVAGTVYSIAVGGWSGHQGKFALSWSPLVLGTPGDDVLVGTPSAEEIRGLGGNDIIKGLEGADVLVGGAGRDQLRGGPGNDVLLDRKGSDFLGGGPGNDVLDARDWVSNDRADGGPGRDRCRLDSRDARRRCP